MSPYLETLKSGLARDGELPVAEVLYRCYRELHPSDSETIRSHFTHLNDILEKLTLEECDQVWYLVCDLCSQHEREGFLEGLHVGAALMTELAEAETGGSLEPPVF